MNGKGQAILELPSGLSGTDLVNAVNDRIRQMNQALAGVSASTPSASKTVSPYVTAAGQAPLAPILGAAVVAFTENLFNWTVPVTLQADASRVSCYMQAQMYSDAGHTTIIAPWYTLAPEINVAQSGTWYSAPYIYAAAGNYMQLRAAAVSTGGLITYSNVVNADLAAHATMTFADLVLQLLGVLVAPALDLKDTRAGHTAHEYQLRVGAAADKILDIYDASNSASVLQIDDSANLTIVSGKLTLTLGNIVLTAGNLTVTAGNVTLTPILNAPLLGTDGTGKVVLKAGNTPTGLNGADAPVAASFLGTNGSKQLVAVSNPVSGGSFSCTAALAKLTSGGANGSLDLSFLDGLFNVGSYTAPT